MEPDRIPSFRIADVVQSLRGRDAGQLYYVYRVGAGYVELVNGKDRRIEKPKRKNVRHLKEVLRPQTRVAEKLRNGDKVLNSELRRDLAYLSKTMQANDLGG
ncbi:MAG: KOW domain-containing RNA-binding protein [Firmicutes bacterium]|nr:KOW domain-containing RNA-binding protein [Bacillota bacterium]